MNTQEEILLGLKNSIKKEATNILGRIFLFLVYYIGLIALGFFLFWGAIEVTSWVFTSALPNVPNLKALILIIIMVAGIWGLAAMIGIYLVKPIFSFFKYTNKNRIEIKEEDAPELFAMIRDVAQKTECQFPKHVYLSTDVNACVFYNTTFWSIFFPVRKNLEIGLGLFHSTNVDEVKSVIAHEFGHFSQKSMKIGSTVYVTNQVLYNLIYTEGAYERWMDKWCMSDTALWAFFGSLTRFVTNQIKRLTVFMYKFVQRRYLRLSRLMEYEADAIACQTTGSTPFISGMYKIEYMSERNDLYEQFLQKLYNEGKRIRDYWTGYSIAENCLSEYDGVCVTVDEVLSETVTINNVYPSKVDVKNVWASHPALQDRIKQAEQLNIANNETNSQRAWTLIPDALKKKMSVHKLNLFENVSFDGLNDEAFAAWISNEIETHFIPTHLKPFFNREFTPFNLQEELPKMTESPFTEDKANTLLEYETAVNDWNILQGVAIGHIEAKEIRYEEKLYNRKDIPLQKHREYLQELHSNAEAIDKEIYAYLMQHSDEHQKIKMAYMAIAYVYSCREIFDKTSEVRDNLVNEINMPVHRDEDDIVTISLQVESTEREIRKFLGMLNYNLLSIVVKTEVLESIQAYARKAHNPSGRIDIELVKEMINVFDSVIEMHQHLRNTAYSIIIDEAVKGPSEKLPEENTTEQACSLIQEKEKRDEQLSGETVQTENSNNVEITEPYTLNKNVKKKKRPFLRIYLTIVAVSILMACFSLFTDEQNSIPNMEINPNLYSDDVLEFTLPEGFTCEEQGHFEYGSSFLFTKDGIMIEMQSGYIPDDSDKFFEECWNGRKDSTLVDYVESIGYRRNLVMRKYNYKYKFTRYDHSEYETLIWEFAMLYNETSDKACLCSCWNVAGSPSYLDEILYSIKFK